MAADGLEFYRGLTPIRRFGDVGDIGGFRRAPDGWSVILSDIRGSTLAIRAGRYKDVNLIGAATIAVIQNVLGTRDFPFVFGGDGATAVLPDAHCARVTPELERLQAHARSAFDLELRVGIVPLAVVRARGSETLIGRYQMAPQATIAVFQGGGLQVAERILKREPEGAQYLLDGAYSKGAPALETLSCRWSPIPSRNGSMLSVLIQAMDLEKAPEVYASVLAELNPLFDGESFRPASVGGLAFGSFRRGFARERALRADLDWRGAFRRILVPMFFARLMKWAPFVPGARAFRRYLADSMVNSDDKKMDDALRMVLDCGPEQAQRLEDLLERRHRAGELAYGLHKSSSALMTCLMAGLAAEQHIHFIDGSDGGYAMAALDLKARLKVEHGLPAKTAL